MNQQSPAQETNANGMLRPCPVCQHMVSCDARACPQCGHPLKTGGAKVSQALHKASKTMSEAKRPAVEIAKKAARIFGKLLLICLIMFPFAIIHHLAFPDAPRVTSAAEAVAFYAFAPALVHLPLFVSTLKFLGRRAGRILAIAFLLVMVVGTAGALHELEMMKMYGNIAPEAYLETLIRCVALRLGWIAFFIIAAANLRKESRAVMNPE